MDYFYYKKLEGCKTSKFNPQLDDIWKHYKKLYLKHYKDKAEDDLRRGNLEKVVNEISHHNLLADLGMTKFTRGLNKYSDLTKEEFQKYLTGYRPENDTKQHKTHQRSKRSDTSLPKTIDWVKKGAVTSVPDQGHCASCWAFVALGSLEAQQYFKTGTLKSLSVQNIIDCATEKGDGCDAGLMITAYKYAEKNGVDTRHAYPYKEKEGKCMFDDSKVGATCSGYKILPKGDVEELKKTVATIGPVAAAFNGHLDSFHDYKRGIYDDKDCKSDDLNHAVLVVGYGTEDDTDYWLIRNSWGKSWGDNGYMKLLRNSENLCGIATRASYPMV
ncbi:cathepsin L-like peptidase isoform X2 [Parasteatoda tepidariorum]|uniref:cathepsin L-like peptidase isoform X2 n=1 Tax=Parasteatoda tepidariorum TaxID=114398 RepID=UPI001C71F137|nr:procathepsin L-like isoform X2 [Parasteatoda tepidariorum]